MNLNFQDLAELSAGPFPSKPRRTSALLIRSQSLRRTLKYSLKGCQNPGPTRTCTILLKDLGRFCSQKYRLVLILHQGATGSYSLIAKKPHCKQSVRWMAMWLEGQMGRRSPHCRFASLWLGWTEMVLAGRFVRLIFMLRTSLSQI